MTSERNGVDSGRPTRRALLAGCAAFAMSAVSPALAQAQSYASISVDVSPLRAFGIGGRHLEDIRSLLTQAMQRAFAGRVGLRSAPQLVVRLSAIQLSPDTGMGGTGWRRGGDGSSSSDYMEGEALVLSGRQVIKRHPQLLALPSSTGGAWYSPDNERRRVVALCEAYAGWLARSL